MAPTAPTAPAWLTVATPNRMDPSTTKIKLRGGSSAINTLTKNWRS